jgi:hypothetical protein
VLPDALCTDKPLTNLIILIIRSITVVIIIIIIIIISVPPSSLRDFQLFGVCPTNKHCPSAQCAYAANAVGKDLDIFAVGAVSLRHIEMN